MRENVKEIYERATRKYFWSLRIGKFVNDTTGEDLRESLGVSTFLFRGSLKEWCATLLELAINMFSGNEDYFMRYNQGRKDMIYAGAAAYKNLSMVDGFNNYNVCRSSDLPFDVVMPVSEDGEAAVIRILDMNENGSIL